MTDDPSPSSSPDQDDGKTPFERFEDVLRKVVTVPKSEVDNQLRKHRES